MPASEPAPNGSDHPEALAAGQHATAPDGQPIRVAALDCGTNTFRLYIADVYPDGAQRQLVRETRIVRLGQGVDVTGEIAPIALARAFTAAREFAKLIDVFRPERARMVATSASRDARNSGDFVAGIEKILQVAPEVIPGKEEAALAFAGATRGLHGKYPAPYLVVDLGGGSTELVLGDRAPTAEYSMDVGSVRLTERHLRSDPPSSSEIKKANDDVGAMLAVAATQVPIGNARTIVGVAGTVTSLTAHYLGLRKYDPAVVDGTALSPVEVERACTEMVALSREQRMALGFMQTGRADIIGAGAVIWRAVVERVCAAARAEGHEIAAVVSRESDMLEGIAAVLASADAAQYATNAVK